MQSARLLLSIVLMVILMPVSVFAVATGVGPFDCSNTVDETFSLTPPGACFRLKAECKNDSAGADISVQRSFNTISVLTSGVDPSCSVSSNDSDLAQKKLKAECVSDDGSEATTKLELSREDNLCTPCCLKPIAGSCSGVCGP